MSAEQHQNGADADPTGREPWSDGDTRFADRPEAGRALGERVRALELQDPVVVALPRGGVPVGFEVAAAISAPLEICVVRKIGVPDNPELALGAIADDGRILIDSTLLEAFDVSREWLLEVVGRERQELARRRRIYLAGHTALDLHGRDVVAVDDGLATGSTAVVAARALRDRGAARVVLAVPVAPRTIEAPVRRDFDRLVILRQPPTFGGVGRWYDDFAPVRDSEVVELLRRARTGDGRGASETAVGSNR